MCALKPSRKLYSNNQRGGFSVGTCINQPKNSLRRIPQNCSFSKFAKACLNPENKTAEQIVLPSSSQKHASVQEF